MRTTTVLLASLTAGCAAAPAVAATGPIVPGSAIGPVAIGDERAIVELRHGPGTVASSVPNPGYPPNPNWVIQNVRFPAIAITARFPTAEASITTDRIVTRSTIYRTARGVGVATRTATLRARYPAAVCSGTICRLGARNRGAVITRFHLRSARVWKVEIVRLPG